MTITRSPNDNTDQMAAMTLRGNNTASPALAIDLTVAQVIALLSVPSTPVPLSSGGFGNALTPNPGGILYSTAAAIAVLAPAGGSGYPLASGASTTPAWSGVKIPVSAGTNLTLLKSDGTDIVYTSTTWADTGVNNGLAYASGANAISLLTSNSSIFRTNGSGTISAVAMSDGQIPIGVTGGAPVVTGLTQGTGLTITTGTGTIALTIKDGGTDVVNQTSTTVTMATNTSYIANNASLVTLTLPATSNLGDIIEVVGAGAGGWQVAQGSGQLIHLGSAVTTTGVSGYLASAAQYNSVIMKCITADTEWTVISQSGSPTTN